MSEHSETGKFHYHEPGLQHQFEDMQQQEESVSIGMWMFLVQEIMFFGGLFTAYLVFRSKYPMAFAAGSNHLDAFWGGLNTLVLIVSSLTMALTVYYAQKNNRSLQVIMILLTMLFGAVFLGVKAIEYTDKYNHGLIPVTGWNKRIPEKAGEHAAAKPCWEVDHNAPAEEHANPRGEFQFTDCSLVKLAMGDSPEKNFLTESEKGRVFLERADRREQVPRQGAHFLLPVFRDDGPARAPHGDRPRSDDLAADRRVARHLQ
jgi:hypothetical protein